MGIPGLDAWLTNAPEEPDWVEEAEKWLKRHEGTEYGEGDQGAAVAHMIIEELLRIVKEEL